MRCSSRGPRTRAQCDRFSDGHTAHHSLVMDERWTDADADEYRRIAPARELDALLAAYNATAPDASGVMGERP